MIGLIIYIVGVIIAGIWGYHQVKDQYLKVTLNDFLIFTCFCLFSWATVIILGLLWLNENGSKIILWEEK